MRFPTSRHLDGSDAMNPFPDYSAAYVVLRTSAGREGYGLAFTVGRGNDVQVAGHPGAGAAGGRATGRRPRQRPRRAVAPADRRQPAALARAGEGRHPHGRLGRAQRVLGPGRPRGRQAPVEAAGRPDARSRSCPWSTSGTCATRSPRTTRSACSARPPPAGPSARRRCSSAATRRTRRRRGGSATTTRSWPVCPTLAVADGFELIKLKVGANLADDVRRLRDRPGRGRPRHADRRGRQPDLGRARGHRLDGRAQAVRSRTGSRNRRRRTTSSVTPRSGGRSRRSGSPPASTPPTR